MLLAFLIGALTQQGMYEVSKEGLHFSKPEALIFSVVAVGTTIGLYQSMDIADGPNFARTAITRSIPPWMGMVTSAGLTLAIPEL